MSEQVVIKDVHSHKCWSCGHVWKHDGSDMRGLRRWGEAWYQKRMKMHTCPKCKKQTYKRVDGTWEP